MDEYVVDSDFDDIIDEGSDPEVDMLLEEYDIS